MSFVLTNHYGIIDYVKKFNAKKELSIYGAHLESKINSILKNSTNLDPRISTLLFTNTRNQSERWHQCLRYACPEMENS